MEDIETANAETNTNPYNNINIINADKKKKPHNITIKNYNPNEPKSYPNMKYTEKQLYRRYKTKTEPKLHQSIMIDEEDDIINTIKKAFGIENENKRNYSTVETSGADYVKDPEPIEVEQSQLPDYIYDIPKKEGDTNAPETPKPRKRDMQVALSTPSTPSTSTELTGTIIAPIAISPKARFETILNKAKERTPIPPSPKTEAAKSRLDELTAVSHALTEAENPKITALSAKIDEANKKLKSGEIPLEDRAEFRKALDKDYEALFIEKDKEAKRKEEERQRINKELQKEYDIQNFNERVKSVAKEPYIPYKELLNELNRQKIKKANRALNTVPPELAYQSYNFRLGYPTE
jgi:hypothetical protein